MIPSVTLWSLLFVVFWMPSLHGQQQTQVLQTKWKVYEYPNPRYQPKMCGRVKESWICDPNGIITETDDLIRNRKYTIKRLLTLYGEILLTSFFTKSITSNDIENTLRRIHSETRCDCQQCQIDETGYVVMVAIMPMMHRLMFNVSRSRVDETFYNARAYAYYLSLYWDFTPGCAENVILLYCRDDDVLYTLTYRDARQYLTDDKVTDITMRAARHFKFGTTAGFGRGLKQMVQDYYTILKEKKRG